MASRDVSPEVLLCNAFVLQDQSARPLFGNYFSARIRCHMRLLDCTDPDVVPGLYLWLTVGLKFERFGGEPDGGIGWVEDKVPFIFLEVGVSDTKIKMANRVRHCLFKVQGKAILCSEILLMIRKDSALPCP
jgi:hypothetical protein